MKSYHHTLPVKRNYWCAALITRSARLNRFFHLLTSALDIWRRVHYLCVQELQKMATNRKSFLEMYDAYCSRSNERQMCISNLDEVAAEHNFDSIKSCLAIGAGEGFYEIGFLEKCTANIIRFIAVDQDRGSTERLKSLLRKRTPGVEATVIESDFHSWKGPNDPVDLILTFHMLYSCYHKPGERQALLKKAHDHWLVPGGFLVAFSCGCFGTKSCGATYEIFERLGSPLTTWDEIEADILSVGFIKRRVHEIPMTRDFSNPDEALLCFYQAHVDQPVTLDDVRSAMEELYPGDEPYQGVNTLIVYQKAP